MSDFQQKQIIMPEVNVTVQKDPIFTQVTIGIMIALVVGLISWGIKKWNYGRSRD